MSETWRQQSAEHRILAIGSVLGVDDEGYLIGQSSPDKIVAPWNGPVSKLRTSVLENVGDDLHSLYVRGSISRGTAIEGFSDLDAVILTKKAPSIIDHSWLEQFETSLKVDYPFVAGLDCSYLHANEIQTGNDKQWAFFLKVLSACVEGDDLAPILPKVKPGRDTLIVAPDIRILVEGELDLLPDEIATRMSTWGIGKRLVRAGFELVMEREQAYTRDLYPCYERFAKYYPEKAEEMYAAMDMALYTAEVPQRAVDLLGSLGPWLADEYDRLYGVV